MKTYPHILENSMNRLSLAQDVRADIIGEFEAIIQYEYHISNSNDPTVNETLRDIVNEEKHHVGQLMGLLFFLDPDSQKDFEEGLTEFYNSQKN